MTVTENIKDAAETVKEAVGLGHGHSAPTRRTEPSKPMAAVARYIQERDKC